MEKRHRKKRPLGSELIDAVGFRSLTQEEARALHARYRDEGDLAARNELIVRTLPWAIKVARRFAKRLNDHDAIESAATWALMTAVERWDPSRGSFTNVVQLHVRSKVGSAMRKEFDGGLRGTASAGSPGHTLRQSDRLRRRAEGPFRPDRPSLVREANSTGTKGPVGDGGFVSAAVADHRGRKPDEDVAHAESIRDLIAAIEALPEPRDREVLNRRMAGETLEAIGEALGISRERVRQIEERAYERLRMSLCAERRIRKVTGIIGELVDLTVGRATPMPQKGEAMSEAAGESIETETEGEEILTNYDFGSAKSKSSYPWERWADGQMRRLRKGREFTAKPKTVERAARKYAAEKNLLLRIKIEGEESIVIQFEPKMKARPSRAA